MRCYLRLAVLLPAAGALLLLLGAARAALVTYRIDCDDRNTGYLSGSDTVTGTQFTGGHNWTNTGTVDLPLDTPQYIHIWGQEFGGGNWMRATFTAPWGYQFAETESRLLMTNRDSTKQPGRALWSASLNVPWDNASYTPWDPDFSSYEPGAGTGDGNGGDHPAGNQQIWSFSTGDNQSVYFSTQATLELAPPTVVSGSPLGSVSTAQGLSAQVVHTNYDQFGNIDNLGEADAALNLRPGDAGHYASQVTTVARAHIDTDGNYGGEVGSLLPAQRENTDRGINYATRLAGYVYAPTDNYVRSFAVGSDDGFRLKVGDTVVLDYLNGRGVPNPHDTIPVQFPTAGYWPIEITWFQGGGGLGLEVSSREGEWRSSDWNTTDFQILGTDPSFPIYQRPGGVPNPADAGLESVAPRYAGAVDMSKADGLRVQVLTKGSGWGNIQEVEDFFNANPVDAGVVTKSSVFDYHGSGGTGNFGTNNPFPTDPGFTGNDFAMRFNGLVYIPQPGDYSIAVGTDDAFRLKIAGQTFGEYPGGRGIAGGWANYAHVNFPQQGLYPVEFYFNQGGGGYGAEVSVGAFPGLIVTGKNPATTGFTPDMTGMVFSVEPVARLVRVGHELKGAAYAHVPALGMDIAPESWALMEIAQGYGPRVAGLKGEYYDYAGHTGEAWNDTLAPVATRGDVQTGNTRFDDNFAYGLNGGALNLEEQFGVRWTGYLNVPESGQYSFRMETDDVSWIFIDVDRDGTLEGSPENQRWTVFWNDLTLEAGLHEVEFRAREYGGGEWSEIQWDTPWGGWERINAGYLSQNVFDDAILDVIASGDWKMGGTDLDALLASFPMGDQRYLRLETLIAGLRDSVEGQFTFVPEPSTWLLLAFGGLGVLACRRRRARRAARAA